MDGKLAQADLYFKNRKYKKALSLYEEIIVENSDNAKAYQGLATCSLIVKKTNKAIEMSNRALLLEPDLVIPHVVKAYAYHVMGDIENFETEIKIAVSRDPESANVLSCYGFFLITRKDFTNAIQVLEKAVMSDPSVDIVHERLAYAYLQSGDNQSYYRQARIPLKQRFILRNFYIYLVSMFLEKRIIINLVTSLSCFLFIIFKSVFLLIIPLIIVIFSMYGVVLNFRFKETKLALHSLAGIFLTTILSPILLFLGYIIYKSMIVGFLYQIKILK